MKLPLEIEFRNVNHSEGLRELIEERAAALDERGVEVMRCRVVLERPNRHQRNHQLFHVGIELTVKGSTLTVTHDPGDEASHEDPYATVRDAFKAAKRQLGDHSAKKRRFERARLAEVEGEA